MEATTFPGRGPRYIRLPFPPVASHRLPSPPSPPGASHRQRMHMCTRVSIYTHRCKYIRTGAQLYTQVCIYTQVLIASRRLPWPCPVASVGSVAFRRLLSPGADVRRCSFTCAPAGRRWFSHAGACGCMVPGALQSEGAVVPSEAGWDSHQRLRVHLRMVQLVQFGKDMSEFGFQQQQVHSISTQAPICTKASISAQHQPQLVHNFSAKKRC